MDLIIINSPNLIKTVKERWIIGESALGGLIGEYSKSPLGKEYKAFKTSFNPRANGNVDLTLTGALSNGLTLKKATKTSFTIFSTDEKFNKIGNKYGFEEFNLSDSEWLELSEEILSFALEKSINRVYNNS